MGKELLLKEADSALMAESRPWDLVSAKDEEETEPLESTEESELGNSESSKNSNVDIAVLLLQQGHFEAPPQHN